MKGLTLILLLTGQANASRITPCCTNRSSPTCRAASPVTSRIPGTERLRQAIPGERAQPEGLRGHRRSGRGRRRDSPTPRDTRAAPTRGTRTAPRSAPATGLKEAGIHPPKKLLNAAFPGASTFTVREVALDASRTRKFRPPGRAAARREPLLRHPSRPRARTQRRGRAPISAWTSPAPRSPASCSSPQRSRGS